MVVFCAVFLPINYVILKLPKTIFPFKVMLSVWRWELKVLHRIFLLVLFLHVNCIKEFLCECASRALIIHVLAWKQQPLT